MGLELAEVGPAFEETEQGSKVGTEEAEKGGEVGTAIEPGIGAETTAEGTERGVTRKRHSSRKAGREVMRIVHL